MERIGEKKKKKRKQKYSLKITQWTCVIYRTDKERDNNGLSHKNGKAEGV